MNRLLSIPLLLGTCTLCFVAGYKLGKESQPPAAIPTEAIVVEAPVQQLTDTNQQPQVTPQLPEEEPKNGPALNPLELRAQETVQTFFDTNDRKLVAEILEVRVDSLKVRRQSDGQELDLPVSMLSAEDKAFAAYLWEQQPKTSVATPSGSNQPMEDLIWDELFK